MWAYLHDENQLMKKKDELELSLSKNKNGFFFCTRYVEKKKSKCNFEKDKISEFYNKTGIIGRKMAENKYSSSLIQFCMQNTQTILIKRNCELSTSRQSS